MTGGAYALDFGAVMTVAAAQGADLELLSEALPDLELVMLSGMAGDTEED